MSLFKKKENAEISTDMESNQNVLGTNIAELRKKMGLTQEEFAEKLGVTAQAVSKWENGVSCPDIMLLPKIAGIFGISVDELMGVKPIEETSTLTTPQLTDEEISKLNLRVIVTDNENPDKKAVNICVPVAFVAKAAKLGVKISSVLGNDTLSDLELSKVIDLVKSGVTGEILHIDTDDNKVVTIEVS